MTIDHDHNVAVAARVNALKAAMEASKLVLPYWDNPGNSLFKKKARITKTKGKRNNFAMIADKLSETAIIQRIRRHPLLENHLIYSEESKRSGTDTTWQWFIDPLDGTSVFRNGLSEFGISIGVLHHGEPVIGVIAVPTANQIMVAWRGHGVAMYTLDGEVIDGIPKKSKRPAQSLDRTIVGFDIGYEEREYQLKKIVGPAAEKIGYPVSYGSCSVANFRLALGLLDSYFFLSPTRFDVAASAVVITEMGGVVSQMDGNIMNLANPMQHSYLASRTPEIHRRMLKLLNK